MMNEAQWAWLVSQVGATDRDAADAVYARVGTPRGVAVEYLQDRLQRITTGPSTVTIPGVVSVSYDGTVRSLERSIALLLAGPEDPTAPGAVGADESPLTMVPLVQRWARGGTTNGSRRPWLGTVRGGSDVV